MDWQAKTRKSSARRYRLQKRGGCLLNVTDCERYTIISK